MNRSTPFRRSRGWFAALAALALVAAACGGGRANNEETAGGGGDQGSGDQVAASPGITDTEVKLGGSLPLSGPASNFGTIKRAQEAYFKYVNEELGGVKMGDGKTRKISFVYYDDAYNPPQTAENARRLIEQDRVFALFGILGTPTNSAIWDYVNQQEVPHTFLYTGATKWGADLEDHPYSIGWLLPYAAEAVMYVDHAAKTKPNGKVAILYQNDDFGLDYVNQIEKAAPEAGLEIVAKQSYATTDPTVDSQVATLATSGADIWFNISTGKFAAQAITAAARSGWKPLNLQHSGSAVAATVLKPAGAENSKGIIAAKWLKEVGDPRWVNDPAIKQFQNIATKYGDRLDVNDQVNLSGMAASEVMVKVLERTQAPTRDSFMEAIRSLDKLESGYFLPGVTITTGPDDGFMFESAQLYSFNGTTFDPAGDLVSFEGATPTEDVPGV